MILKILFTFKLYFLIINLNLNLDFINAIIYKYLLKMKIDNKINRYRIKNIIKV